MRHSGGVLGFFLLAAALWAGMALLSGCEDSPSDEGASSYFTRNPYQSTSRPSESGQAAALSITPTRTGASPGQQINFQAVDGIAPFTWRVGTAANGSLAAQANTRYAIYTHLGSTNSLNNVIVTDNSGATAIADVN